MSARWAQATRGFVRTGTEIARDNLLVSHLQMQFIIDHVLRRCEHDVVEVEEFVWSPLSWVLTRIPVCCTAGTAAPHRRRHFARQRQIEQRIHQRCLSRVDDQARIAPPVAAVRQQIGEAT